MTAPDLTDLTDDQLSDLVEFGTDEESMAAFHLLNARWGISTGPGEDDDEPCDWRADRASDAWERGRDRVAERAR
ncbi:MAG: hypothetical protein KBG29_01890 [Pseudomonadales bacterium]|nr:hypothetical protein [Pseudomonadales bacterium]